MNFKQELANHIKNIPGWRTNRKLIIFSVDDYGNVRLDSKRSREKMNDCGLKILSRFDALDALETREDLEALYEVLSLVKDRNNRNAVFTPFALPCNINFEAMAANNYQQYIYEILPETYRKLSSLNSNSYEGAWELWQEGIEKGLMKPQFHGREHFNLKVFNEKLLKKDGEILNALKNRSYTSISESGYSTIGYTAAFEFDKFKENYEFEAIINDGLMRFEEVYGYKSIHFNPPGASEHPIIHKFLKDAGIKYSDTQFIKNEHQGEGKWKKTINYTGKKNEVGMTYQVRNVVFEPTFKENFDSVSYALNQIKTAFFWNRPAIISSHRVNFCGHIDPKNREIGLSSLKMLLKKIVQSWPDVEFMSTVDLGALIVNEH
jgi:hypothetical protein